ncbi:MAG TPA: hypothetical protein PLY93_07225 [Turneriella sp.]|nr:hypothetical protein [Turneriella sp.]
MRQQSRLFDVRSDGTFILNDTLFIDYRQSHLADLTQELLTLKKRLARTVLHSLKDDNRLLGQEKANISNTLLGILRALAALRLKLFDSENISSFADNPKVLIGGDGYIVEGKLSAQILQPSFSIDTWRQAYLEGAIDDFIHLLKNAAVDKVFTLEERVELTQALSACRA